MSLLPFLLISIAVTGAALMLRGRPTVATFIVLGGLVASLIAALAIRPGETVEIGGATIATTDFLRLFLVLGCLSGLALALLGAGAGTRRDAPAVMLGTLAAAALALSLPDARSRCRPQRSVACSASSSRSSRPVPASGQPSGSGRFAR